MEINKRLLTFENGALLLALALALFLRFFQLGAAPLNESEANLALQALEMARGGHPVLSAQPGYLLPSALWMMIFGSGNAVARFWPALAGSLLVLAPFFFQRWLGRWPALALSFFLAIDPALVSLSRQADAASWAIAFSLLAAGLLLNKSWNWGGICLGLALLGGPAVWAGAVVFGLAALLSSWLPTDEQKSIDAEPVTEQEPRLAEWKNWLPWAAGALLIAGTLLGTRPAGLSAAVASLPAYITGWWQPQDLAALPALMAFFLSAPAALLLAFVQTISGWVARNRTDRFLGFTWLIGLLLVLAMPGRSYAYLTWVMIPLWALAARGMIQMLTVKRGDRVWILGETVIFTLLLILIWLSLRSLNTVTIAEDIRLRWLTVGAAVLILIVTIIALAWSWNVRTAFQGALAGLTIVLLTISLSNMVRSAAYSGNASRELWRTGVSPTQAELISQTVGDLSEWKVGNRYELDGVVVGIDSDALRWLLRDHPAFSFSPVMNIETTPSLVLTDAESPQLASAYTGQDFNWYSTPAWSDFSLAQWWEWWTERRALMTNTSLILWARGDVLPGGVPLTDQPAQ